MTEEIEVAAARCRAAFAATPNAMFAWCCHHKIEFELLTEPAERRIQYILEAKPEYERVTRLNNFRPVLAEIPRELSEAGTKFLAALNNVRGSGEIYYTPNPVEFCRADKELHDCYRDLDKNWITDTHKLEVPDHTWDLEQSTIFPKKEIPKNDG